METASITFSRAAPTRPGDANQTKEAPQTVCLVPAAARTRRTRAARATPQPAAARPEEAEEGTGAARRAVSSLHRQGRVHTCGNFGDNAPAPVAAPPPLGRRRLEERRGLGGLRHHVLRERGGIKEGRRRRGPPKPSRSPSPSPPRACRRGAAQKGGQKCGPWFQYWLENDAAASEEFWQALGARQAADPRPLGAQVRGVVKGYWAIDGLQSATSSTAPARRAAAPLAHGRSPSPSPDKAPASVRRRRAGARATR